MCTVIAPDFALRRTPQNPQDVDNLWVRGADTVRKPWTVCASAFFKDKTAILDKFERI